MKLCIREDLASRLLSIEAHCYTRCFSTLSSLSPAESVAQILQSEFGVANDFPTTQKQKALKTTAASENEGGHFSDAKEWAAAYLTSRGTQFKHEQQHANPQSHGLGDDTLHLRVHNPNPHLHTFECQQQGHDNPHAPDLTLKHRDADSRPLHGPDSTNDSGNTHSHGNSNLDAQAHANQHSPAGKQLGPCPRTSQEIIKLLIDRVNTQSWIALNKDIQDSNIEIKPKEVAWVLKVLKNPKRARELFIWAAQRPGYTHDATCYAVMINSLGDDSDHSFLNDLLAEMEKKNIQLTVTTVNRLIGIYASGDEIDKAEHYFLKLQKLGMQPSAFTYKCMLQAFAKTGKCKKALEMYTVMQTEEQPIDVVSCNILLDGLSKNGQAESALKIFEEMKTCGNLADVYTYTIMARVYGQLGMVDKALHLLEEMVQNGVEPNKHTYNTVLDALAQVQDKLDDAVKVFKKMAADGVYPDAISCHCIFKALCKGRQVGLTRELALCIKDKGVRKEACESFIKVLAKMGYLQIVLALFKIIKLDNLQPSRATCLAMIDALCRGAEPNEAMIILKEVEDKRGPVPLTVYNTILTALRNNNQFQAAYDLFKQMKRRGPSPDVVSFNIIIAGLIKGKQLPRAERLFEEMDRSGCMPNVVTFNSLLHSFARLGDVSSVRKLLQMMHDKEVTPDIVTYNCTIQCYGKAGKPKVVLKVFKEMKEKGVSPSFLTYNHVLLALADAGFTDEALSNFEQMKDQGLLPDAMTFTILRRLYDSDPQLDKKQLVEEIDKAGLTYELSA